jgi:hypothetical protein
VLKCWNVGVLECAEILECRNVECWNDSVGVLECWGVGELGFRIYQDQD